MLGRRARPRAQVRTLIVTDPLDDLLGKASQPDTEQLHSFKLRQAMDLAFADAKAEGGPRCTPKRSRSRAAGAVLGLGLLVAGVGAVPAFAELVGLRTGTYDVGPNSAFSAKAPERELWRIDSPELVPQLQAWTIDYPLAPGLLSRPTRPAVREREEHSDGRGQLPHRRLPLQRVHLG